MVFPFDLRPAKVRGARKIGPETGSRFPRSATPSASRVRLREIVAILVLVLLGAAAYAAETITYTYDARGRLVRVSHSGTVNNNVVTNYTYDKADNRTNTTTTGAPPPPP